MPSVTRLSGAFAALTVLAGAAVLPQVAAAQMMPATMHKTMSAMPNGKEKHPELQAALRALEQARKALQKGAHDYSGERVEALKDTDKAIAEVRQAITKDRK
ncbi:hypothetical protein [Phormidesmis priestleyi]|uniref:hypothetical protein n=1 Tax=Phormidesmis priestleyi TaxID=268141 RepID=UPI00083A7791|nr:hypothetical protein [Phormidesmis priestleyi]